MPEFPGHHPDAGGAPATSGTQPALRLVEAMRADGVDLNDEDAVRRWLQAFNERPTAERIEMLGGQDLIEPATDPAAEDAAEPPVLPPVQLAPLPELAAAARAAPLLLQAARLAEWVGDRRQVTSTGVLRFADAKAAIHELGLLDGSGRDAETALEGLRSTRDLPELQLLWTLATHTGMIIEEGQRVSTGPTAAVPAGGSDDDVLDTWYESFHLLTGGSQCCEGLAGIVFGHSGIPFFEGHLSGVLLDLYVTGEPVSTDDLVTATLERVQELLDDPEDDPATRDDNNDRMREHWDQRLRTQLPTALGWLSQLGAVEMAHDTAALTPLGVWAIQHGARQEGIRAPVVGELAGSSAAELLDGVLGYENSEDVDVECAAWLGNHEPAAAATELLAAARVGSAATRPLVFDVLNEIGQPAVPAVRAAFEERPLRPYARVWLAQHGVDVSSAPDDPAELGWMVGDLCAALLDCGAEDELDTQLGEFVEPGTLEWVVGAVENSGHPQTIEVLAAIGRQASEEQGAKAARKAALTTRSRD